MVVGRTGGVGGPQPIQPVPAGTVQRAYAAPKPAAASDRAEISLEAKLLKKLHELPDVRQDKVDQIRKQIEDGSYDSEEKIRAVVERLLEDI